MLRNVRLQDKWGWCCSGFEEQYKYFPLTVLSQECHMSYLTSWIPAWHVLLPSPARLPVTVFCFFFLSVGFMSLDFVWQRTLPPGKKWRSKSPSGVYPGLQLRERAPVWRAVRLRQMQWHLESNVNYQRTMDIGWLAKMSSPYLLSAPIDHWSSFLQRGAVPSLTFWCLVGFYHLGWSPGCVASEKY